MTRILANAVVDQVRFGPVPLWEVRVWGGATQALDEDDADHVRTYQLTARSDSLAVQEGIRRFIDEIEALSEWK